MRKKEVSMKKKIIIAAFLLGTVAFLMSLYVLGGLVYAFNDVMLYEKKVRVLLIILSLITAALIIWLAEKKGVLTRLSETLCVDSLKRSYIKHLEYYSIEKKEMIILFIIIAMGLILRVIGYNWGLVATWQPDENKLTRVTVEMINQKLPYTSNVFYPNQFTSKIATIFVFIFYKITGLPLVRETAIEAVHIFRLIVVLAGTITIYVAYLIGNMIKPRLGIIFAALISVYPQYVLLAKQVTGDVDALLFISLIILFSLKYVRDGKIKYIILMSMGAAMATLEKWHGAVGIGFIGIFLLFNCKSVIDYIKKGIVAVVAYFAWLSVFAPNIVVRPIKTIQDGFINIAVYDGSQRAPFISMIKIYLRYGYSHIGGILCIAVFLTGIIYLIVTHNRYYSILLLGPIKTVCLSFINRSFPRWGLELYFTELVILSLGIYYLIYNRKTVVRVLGMIASCLILLEFLSGAILSDCAAAAGYNDTRLLQRRECEAKGITPYNSTGKWYTGFMSNVDSEYGDAFPHRNIEWDDYFLLNNGKMCRTDIQPDYVCLNLSVHEEDRELAEELDPICKKVLEYKRICKDVVRIPYESTQFSYNDLKILVQNVVLSSRVLNGGYVGDDITVYYVGDLPVIERSDGDM